MCELPGLGPSSFNKNVENFKQFNEASRLLVIAALKNFAMVRKCSLNQFNNVTDS